METASIQREGPLYRLTMLARTSSIFRMLKDESLIPEATHVAAPLT